MKTLDCIITSAKEELYSGSVTMVTVSGNLGELGILPGHAPLLTQLVPGPVTLSILSNDPVVFYLSGGFLEVQPGSVQILADTARRTEQLEEHALEAARREAELVLTKRSDDFDYAQAALYLAEITAQLRTLRQIRTKLSQ